MALSRRMQRPALAATLALAVALVVAGCNASQIDGVESDPNGTPRIVHESTGGIATLRVTVEVDSATASWRRTTCRLPLDGAPCGDDKHVEGGAIDADVRDRLFADARSRPFLELPARYRAAGPVADGMAHRLAITTSGYTRTMLWEDGAELPPLLEQYVTTMFQALHR